MVLIIPLVGYSMSIIKYIVYQANVYLLSSSIRISSWAKTMEHHGRRFSFVEGLSRILERCNTFN